MEIRIPTQIIVYILGIIGVIIVTGSLMGAITFLERRFSRRKLNEALREGDSDPAKSA